MGFFSALAAAAAVVGTGYSVHKGQMASKEANRQKSIAASQMAEQNAAIEAEKAKEAANAKALQDEIIRKQREANTLVADKTASRKMRGRRSLIFGSETGINTPSQDTLG